MGCLFSLFKYFPIRNIALHTSPDVTKVDAEQELSMLICHYVKRATSRVPFKLWCVVTYHRLYNAIASIYWLVFHGQVDDVKWGEVVGSYAEKSCVGKSDVDFLLCNGLVFCDPFEIVKHQSRGLGKYRSRGLIVQTHHPQIPPGCCWLQVCDKRHIIPGSLGPSSIFEDCSFECYATEIDGHTHYPYRNQMDKVICYRPAGVKRVDGSTYFSCKKFSDFHSNKGLTEYDWINRLLPSWSSHGPAFTQTYFGVFEIDVAISFLCNGWPVSAVEMLTRSREHDWPSKQMLLELGLSGFNVVPIPSKITFTEDADFEWRISFRNAETKLVRSFNECQMVVYRILKILSKEYIQPKYPDEDFISSYVMKTLLFWTIENHGSKIWIHKRLLECLRLCLNNFREWIKDGYCPNYFIPGYNLFRTKIDRMNEVGFRTWILPVLDRDWVLLLELDIFRDLKEMWMRSGYSEKEFTELIVKKIVTIKQ